MARVSITTAKGYFNTGDTPSESNFSDLIDTLKGYFFNVKDYGAVGDGSTNDTTAIQDAINACNTAGGGIVFFPYGIYVVSGSLQTSVGGGNPNSQLYIPATTIETSRHITFLGESKPTWVMSGVNADIPHSGNGVIIKSTLTSGSGLTPAIIGGVGSGGAINYTFLTVENLIFMVDEGTSGPVIGGVNGYSLAGLIVRNCVATTNGSMYTMVEPTADVAAFITSKIGSESKSRIENTAVSCFKIAYVLSEHATVDHSDAFNCYVGFAIQGSNHAIRIYSALVTWCRYPVTMTTATFLVAPQATTLDIHHLSVEIRSSGWNATQEIITDTGNYLRGKCFYEIIEDGTGNDISLTHTIKNGAINLMAGPIKTGIFEWTTSGRPASPVRGMMGYNITTNRKEYYSLDDPGNPGNPGWVSLS